VPEVEREAFSSSVNGLGPDTLASGERELGRLQALKKAMLGTLIEETRTQVGREGGREGQTDGGKGRDGMTSVEGKTHTNTHFLSIGLLDSCSLPPCLPPSLLSLQITAMWEEMSLGLVEREGFGAFRVGMEGYSDDLLRVHEEEVRREGGREGEREGRNEGGREGGRERR